MDELAFVTSFQTFSDIFFEWHVVGFFLKNEDWSSRQKWVSRPHGACNVPGATANQRFLATLGE
jgi:hypothetical protein